MECALVLCLLWLPNPDILPRAALTLDVHHLPPHTPSPASTPNSTVLHFEMMFFACQVPLVLWTYHCCKWICTWGKKYTMMVHYLPVDIDTQKYSWRPEQWFLLWLRIRPATQEIISSLEELLTAAGSQKGLFPASPTPLLHVLYNFSFWW